MWAGGRRLAGQERGERKGERGEGRSGVRRRETRREGGGGKKRQRLPPLSPLPGTVFFCVCSRPGRRLSINLSQCKHSKYSLWLLVKTMRAARIKPSFQMAGGNHMKQGRLVYCCVWLGPFSTPPPPPALGIYKSSGRSGGGVQPQTRSYISGHAYPPACPHRMGEGVWV